MKALILAAAAAILMSAGAVNAGEPKMMTPEECTKAMAECKDAACKEALTKNSGCEMPKE